MREIELGREGDLSSEARGKGVEIRKRGARGKRERRRRGTRKGRRDLGSLMGVVVVVRGEAGLRMRAKMIK